MAKNYWLKLPNRAKTNKIERFNWIMNYIDSKLGETETEGEGEETQEEPEQVEPEPEVTQTGNISVTVTDKDTNEGIKDVLVTVHNDDETINVTGTTGSAGGCTIRDIPYGEYTISAEHDSYIGEVDIVTVDADDVIFDMSIEASMISKKNNKG